MVVPLGSVQPVFNLPPLDQIPDDKDDAPVTGAPLDRLGPLQIPELVFGAGSFSNQYNTDDHLASYIPLRTIRLALRYGIRAFDTSAYYGPSEIVLGTALKALELEFPRSSYQLMTKCGRYGPQQANFDYTPATIRASVERSLSRLHTDFLDVVYLHDIEFMCTSVAPRASGNHVLALSEEKEAYGLKEGEEATVRGNGDQKVLDAFAELRKLQDEGKIKQIGITGYPLATLLRLALLVLHTAPYKPVDIILSYSHLTLQNSTLVAFASQFRDRARVKQLLTASPLSMGLLTPSPPPWHPSPKEMRTALAEGTASWAEKVPSIALGYTIRESRKEGLAVAVGYSSPREVHESVRVLRKIRGEGIGVESKTDEEKMKGIFGRSGFLDWSWFSP